MESAQNPLFIPFHFFGLENAINPLVMSWLVTLVFIALFLAVRRNLKDVPRGLQNFFEMLVDFVWDMAEPLVGKNTAFFFPLFFYLFFFILVCNLIGLIPGSMSPTSRVDVNAGMALVVFLSTHFWGVKEKGLVKYLSHFLPPAVKADPSSGLGLKIMMKVISVALLFMMPVIHIISELTKPVSLTMRLFGNIMGKEKILAVLVLLSMAFWGNSFLSKCFAFAPGLFRVAIVVLGVFVCFIQAFVFMLLAMVYIGGAVQELEGHGGEQA